MISRELVRKYNLPGPRYTSYPTALQFSDTVATEELATHAAASEGPISLYFHLPFCESLCWFCACTTVITRSLGKADLYLDHLTRELDLLLPGLKPSARRVEQLHLGGGSPSFFTPDQMQRLMDAIHERFEVLPDAEVSVELDPRSTDEDKIAVLAKSGFNRASLGVQDFNPSVQQAVHRIQPFEMTRDCVLACREHGFKSVNIDLIYGLPEQTPDSFDRTISQTLELNPDRFAIFSYAHVPWVAPAQKILESRSTLPEAELKLSMLMRVMQRLPEAGYRQIGMDHFARPDDELARAYDNGTIHRNFQGYSTKAGRDLCAFGMSAISSTVGSYRQNHKELPRYQEAVAHGDLPIARGYILTPEDRIRRAAIMDIMCSGRLDFVSFSTTWEVDPRDYFDQELNSLDDLEADGLLTQSPDGIVLSEAGRMLVRVVAMRFDAHLQARQAERRHAKTI